MRSQCASNSARNGSVSHANSSLLYDDAAFHELVSEFAVLIPEGLLANAASMVPVHALRRRHREHRHDRSSSTRRS
jgi:hypothetical protein